MRTQNISGNNIIMIYNWCRLRQWYLDYFRPRMQILKFIVKSYRLESKVHFIKQGRDQLPLWRLSQTGRLCSCCNVFKFSFLDKLCHGTRRLLCCSYAVRRSYPIFVTAPACWLTSSVSKNRTQSQPAKFIIRNIPKGGNLFGRCKTQRTSNF